MCCYFASAGPLLVPGKGQFKALAGRRCEATAPARNRRPARGARKRNPDALVIERVRRRASRTSLCRCRTGVLKPHRRSRAPSLVFFESTSEAVSKSALGPHFRLRRGGREHRIPVVHLFANPLGRRRMDTRLPTKFNVARIQPPVGRIEHEVRVDGHSAAILSPRCDDAVKAGCRRRRS